jgi:hypothetical protein
MADVDFDDFDTGHPTDWPGQRLGATRLTQITHLAGAVCSVALVLGLGFWGYKLAVRDVNGVPVVRAMSGPMRIAPENPGGEVADHQGLAVNTIAALGTAAPPPERLVLAPRPLELTPEDSAGLSAVDAAALAESAPAPFASAALAAAPVAVPVAAAPAENLGPDPDAVAQALAEALAEPTSEAVDAVTEQAASAPVRPRARPASANASGPADLSAALTDTTTVAATSMAEIDPAAIPIGTRLVQLGAFDTPEQARSEWVKLSNQFGSVMAGRALVVQAAESGGRTFYRLRAHGFADETAARGFCTALLEQNASCIPVEQR